MTRVSLLLAVLLLGSGASSLQAGDSDALSAREIVARAQAAAGGETWIHPRTLLMRGHAVFYTPQGPEHHERYDMWRVYPKQKGMAHAADGKVRIESRLNGKCVRLVTFRARRTEATWSLTVSTDRFNSRAMSLLGSPLSKPESTSC